MSAAYQAKRRSSTRAAEFTLPPKWADGKSWLVPKLQELFTPHRNRRLVEPFCGGCAVTFGLQPARAPLNDINAHLINFFRRLQRRRNKEAERRMSNTEIFRAAHERRKAMLTEWRIRLSHALLLAKHNYWIIPLTWTEADGRCCCDRWRVNFNKEKSCDKAGKHPMIKNPFELASRDPAVIKGWWRKWPLANIGGATGKHFNLIVLDVDYHENKS